MSKLTMSKLTFSKLTMSKRALTTATAAILGLSVATAGATRVSAKDFSQLAIGTLAVGSVYYASGSILSKLLSKKLPVPVRVQPYAGSTVSLVLVDQGEIALAIGPTMEIHDAFRGIKPYRKAPTLRMISILYPLMGSIIVRNDSDINTVKDLKGKRVAGVFNAMLVARQLSESILAADGLTWNDVEMVPVSNIRSGGELLAEGRLDAVYFAVGPAQVRELDARISGGVRYLPVANSPEALERIQKIVPNTYITAAKAGMTVGIRRDVHLHVFDNYLIGSTHLSDDLAYKLVKEMHAAADAIKTSFPPFRGFGREKMVKPNVPTPYHAGAVKAYKELGLWTDEMDAAQKKLLEDAKVER